MEEATATTPIEEMVSGLKLQLNDLIGERDTARSELRVLKNKVHGLKDLIVGWADNETDLPEIITELCELFDINPKVTVDFVATIKVYGSVERSLTEENWDLEEAVGDLEATSCDGDVIIRTTDVWEISED